MVDLFHSYVKLPEGPEGRFFQMLLFPVMFDGPGLFAP